MRDGEILDLQWERVFLEEAYLVVGRSKTQAGEGRTVPLNSTVLAALVEYAKWYTDRFGIIQPGWYVFPFGKPRPQDPTRPQVTMKTAWYNTRDKAGVKGRFHDTRHPAVTNLSEKGASHETIKSIVGHADWRMVERYSHIRMQAKRAAMEAAGPGRKTAVAATPQGSDAQKEPLLENAVKDSTQVERLN